MDEEKTPTMWTEELLTKYLRILELAEVDPNTIEDNVKQVIPVELPEGEQSSE